MKKAAMAAIMFSAASALELPTPQAMITDLAVPLVGRKLLAGHLADVSYVATCGECASYLYAGQGASGTYGTAFGTNECTPRLDGMVVAHDVHAGMAYPDNRGIFMSASGVGACVKNSAYYPGNYYPCFATLVDMNMVDGQTVAERAAELCFVTKPEDQNENATNAAVHGLPPAATVVDRVGLLAAAMATEDIIAVLGEKASGFSVLTAALVRLELIDTLSNPAGLFTVFAPTDRAFALALGIEMPETSDAAAAAVAAVDAMDADALTALILNHVIGGYNMLSGGVAVGGLELSVDVNENGGYDIYQTRCGPDGSEFRGSAATSLNFAQFPGPMQQMFTTAMNGVVYPIDFPIDTDCTEPAPEPMPACTDTCTGDDVPTDCDSFIGAAMGCAATCSNEDFTIIVTKLMMAGSIDQECMDRLAALAGDDDDDDDGEPECTDSCTAYPTDCAEVQEMTMTGCAATCNEEELIGVAIMVMDAGIADQACIDEVMEMKFESSSTTTSSSTTSMSSTSSPAATNAFALAVLAVAALAL